MKKPFDPLHALEEITTYERMAHVIIWKLEPVVQVDIVDRSSVNSYMLSLGEDGLYKTHRIKKDIESDEILPVPEKKDIQRFMEQEINKIIKNHRVKKTNIFYHSWNMEGEWAPENFDDIPGFKLPLRVYTKELLNKARKSYERYIGQKQTHQIISDIEQARKYAHEGKFRKAEKILKNLLRENPEDKYYYSLLAHHYKKFNETGKARDIAQEAVKKFSISDKERDAVAQELYMLQNTKDHIPKTKIYEKPVSKKITTPIDFNVPVSYDFADNRFQAIKDSYTHNRLTPHEDFRLIVHAHYACLLAGFDILLGLPDTSLLHLDYQLATAKYVMRQLAGRALLSDEVGLGKTIEAGLILKEYIFRGLIRTCLILVPSSLVSQWQEELQVKFHFKTRIYGGSAEPLEDTDADILIASLHTAKRSPNRERILDGTYDMVIVDEAHKLKSRNTLNWRFINQLHSRFLLLLTATPVQNNPDELYNLITLLKPGLLKTPAEFKKRYLDPHNPRRFRNEEELKELLSQTMVRNTRANTGLELPPRIAHLLPVNLYPEENEIYQGITSYIRNIYPVVHKSGQSMLLMSLLLLQKEAGSSMPALTSTLKKLITRTEHFPQNDELAAIYEKAQKINRFSKVDRLIKLLAGIPDKILIFTEYKYTLQLLKEYLTKAGYPTAVFHGGLSSLEKDRQIEHFRNKAKILISLQSGGEGRNLQFCHNLINFDLPWNPMLIEQRIGRLHRIGQKQSVNIYNIACTGTLEAYILKVLDEKINMFQMVIGEMGLILGDMEGDEVFDHKAFRIWAEGKSPQDMRKEFEQLGKQMLQRKKSYENSRDLDNQLFQENFALD